MERCRHSDSATVDIGLHLSARDITLEIKDAGRGMFPDILQAAREEGRGLGVGLRGMQATGGPIRNRIEWPRHHGARRAAARSRRTLRRSALTTTPGCREPRRASRE
jgi:hypothetical protein